MKTTGYKTLIFSFLLSLGVVFSIPNVTLANGYRVCRLGETRKDIARNAAVTVTAPARTVRWKEFWGRGTYTASPGWAISHFGYRVTSKYKPNHFTWEWVSAGTSFLSQEKIVSIYKNAMNIAAKYGNDNLSAQLKRDMYSVLHLYNSIQSNRSAVQIRIMRRAAGMFRGSRTVTVIPEVNLVCVGTPYQIEQRVQQQLRQLRN